MLNFSVAFTRLATRIRQHLDSDANGFNVSSE